MKMLSERFHHYWRLLFWPLRPGPRNVIAWLLAVVFGISYVGNAWMQDGHITCDFACQWLMGRMLVRGEGHNLYRLPPQEEALKDGYQGRGYRETAYQEMNQDILEKGRWSKDDVEPDGTVVPRGRWFNGEKVEGPLYPPTVALVMWPFAVLDPRAAHTVLVLLYAQMAFLIGWLVRDITRGRIRIGEAALLALIFPGYLSATVLGQNSALSLLIVTAGWALWARNWYVTAGLVWGLFAYKPVFAVALIWVPLLLMNWRMLWGMMASGVAFCLVTLPFCLPPENRYLWEWNDARGKWEWTFTGEGALKAFEPWRRWWEVGQHAADIYAKDPNWVWMSRDLISVPRRAMWKRDQLQAHLEFIARHYLEWTVHYVPPLESVIDMDRVAKMQAFDAEVIQAVQGGSVVTAAGVGLLIGVMGSTIFVLGRYLLKLRQLGQPPGIPAIGPVAAFLLLGSLLTTYHFIHYDLLIMALPVLFLIGDAGRLSGLGRAGLALLVLGLLLCSYDAARGVGNIRLPFEIPLVLLIWSWAGYLTWRAASRLEHGEMQRATADKGAIPSAAGVSAYPGMQPVPSPR